MRFGASVHANASRSVQGSAQLRRHELGLVPHHDAGEAQHQRAVEDDAVLAKLVVDPASGREVVRAVDLDGHDAPVRQSPFAIQIAAAAIGFDADGLPRRLREAEPSAQPADVDLGERLRALLDVAGREQQLLAVPRAACGEERAAELAGRGQPLLHRGRHDAAAGPR